MKRFPRRSFDEAAMALSSLPHLTPLSFLSPSHSPTLLLLLLLLSFASSSSSSSAMKLMKINSLSPKRLFRSKKDRSALSRSDPPSFASSSSSDSLPSTHKPAGIATPTSVLPQMSGDWSDFSSTNTTTTHLEVAQAFKLIDRDNDGVVSRQELESLLKRLLPSQEEVTVMLSEVDCDGDGCIPLEALLHRFGPGFEPAADSELKEAFEVFDTDHDGKISAEELFSVFTAIGDDRCTLEECRGMIAEVDKNGDGFVCFQDFALMMELQR